MPPGRQNMVRPPQPAMLAQAMTLLAAALLIGCVYRLIWLERQRAPQLREQAVRQQVSRTTYLARRGSILDSNPLKPEQHTTLAASYLLDTVYVDPQAIRQEHIVGLIDELGRILGLGASRQAELRGRVMSARAEARRLAEQPEPDPYADAERDEQPARRVALRYIAVQRHISPRQSERIAELIRQPRGRGVGLTPALAREYPAGPLAAHQIGFVNAFGEALEGLEKQFDDKLRGADGSKKVIADARRRPIWSREGDYVRARDGLTVVLNINAVIQAHAERVLAETVAEYQAESGVAVVMDPQTGALWAVANVPTYSPADFASSTDEQRRNRALTDPYEPGSIFKWVVVAAAIDRGVVRPTDRFDCEGGAWNTGVRTIRDVRGYGWLTVREVLVKSSNIGMAKIGLKLGPERMHQGLMDFGFGRKSGIELSGAEDPGLVHPLNRWRAGFSVPSISFGQEISVTAIQMVAAFAVLANGALPGRSLPADAVLSDQVRDGPTGDGRLADGGYLLQPRLVREVIDESQTVLGGPVRVIEDHSRPVVRRRVIGRSTAVTLVDILTEAVEKGTGQKAQIPGVKVFGKTGTAQIAEGGRLLDGQYTASFIGGAPADAPRVVVLVSIRKPNRDIGYYGGTVAAPAAARIIRRTLEFLQVAPDSQRSAHAAQ